ncbi:PARP catalytic domain-containing protein [Entamoeba marina]
MRPANGCNFRRNPNYFWNPERDNQQGITHPQQPTPSIFCCGRNQRDEIVARSESEREKREREKQHKDRKEKQRAAIVLKPEKSIKERLRIDQLHEVDMVAQLVEKHVKDVCGGSLNSIEKNWGLYKDCLASKRFREGKKHAVFTNYEKSGMVVFHGTPEENIHNILENGLKPTKRKYQAHGHGEYFSQLPFKPLNYCKGGRKIVVFYILKGIGDKIKIVNDREIVVINNPLDESYTYCLPLFSNA